MNDTWAIRRLVSQIKHEWQEGETPDAEAALAAHPHLRRWKSIVLDLAFEEFHLRTDGGQNLGPGEFCRRFPEHQRSLLHRIEVEQFLKQEDKQRELLWPKVGEEFLGYRLREELGKGAMGRVFLAQQLEMRDRLVVVKITPRGRREADTLAILNHPHIVPVYRYDEDPAAGLAAICMPYVGRVTLEDLLVAAGDGIERDFPSLLAELQRRFPSGAPSPFPEPQRPKSTCLEGVLEMGRQIAEALAHTHERGVLHLDLKPSNVLLTADGRPLLLDFNLSLEGSIGASVIGGTLPYMSPEQLQEGVLGRSYSSRPVDGRSDVFSLAVMLYELLSGQHPFGEIPRTRDPREAAKELLRRHERGPAPWPANQPIERDVQRFLDACLAYHPDQRPPSAGEAAAALGRFLGRSFRVRRWAKRRRKSLAAAGAVILALILAAAAAVALAPPESERLLHTGQTHLEQQEWRLAEAALRESLAADETSPVAWDLLGQAQFQQDKRRDAFASFHKAFELSQDPRFLEKLGDCERSENEYGLAAGWYQRAIDEGAQSGELHRKLGDSLARIGFFDSAKTHLDEAADWSPVALTLKRTRLQAAINQSLVSKTAIEDSALEDARVIRHSADSTEQDLFTAALAFACVESPERFEGEIRSCLESAAKKEGFRPNRLRGGTPLQAFADRRWYQALLAAE